MVRSEIHIQASPKEVWNALTDFAAYARWNPLIPKVQLLDDTGRAKITIHLVPGLPKFSVAVQIFIRKERDSFCWRGYFVSPRILQGEHFFSISQLNGSGVQFIQGETYSGILAPLIRLAFLPLAQRSFRRMDRSLKNLCESGHS